MDVHIDASALDVQVSHGLATDGPGDRYTLGFPGLTIVINHEQMRGLYAQMRGWFEES